MATLIIVHYNVYFVFTDLGVHGRFAGQDHHHQLQRGEGGLQKPARHMNIRKPVPFFGGKFYMIMKEIFRNLRGI
jgi:hypothetical protein